MLAGRDAWAFAGRGADLAGNRGSAAEDAIAMPSGREGENRRVSAASGGFLPARAMAERFRAASLAELWSRPEKREAPASRRGGFGVGDLRRRRLTAPTGSQPEQQDHRPGRGDGLGHVRDGGGQRCGVTERVRSCADHKVDAVASRDADKRKAAWPGATAVREEPAGQVAARSSLVHVPFNAIRGENRCRRRWRTRSRC